MIYFWPGNINKVLGFWRKVTIMPAEAFFARQPGAAGGWQSCPDASFISLMIDTLRWRAFVKLPVAEVRAHVSAAHLCITRCRGRRHVLSQHASLPRERFLWMRAHFSRCAPRFISPRRSHMRCAAALKEGMPRLPSPPSGF